MHEKLIGRRVKVFLSDGQILGDIAAMQGSQILLTNALILMMPGVDTAIVDTSSGTFTKLVFLPPGQPDTDFHSLVLARVESFAAENKPDKREVDAFVLKELEALTTFQAASDLPYDNSVLNPLEKELLRQHPFDGLWAMLCAKTAISRAQSRYDSSCLHNGNGDAFRHALWNAMMTKKIGRDMAKRWGDAHEEGATPPPPPLEKEMDLFNNEVGRSIDLATTDDPDASNRVQAKVRDGSLKRIVGSQLVQTNSECERPHA